ncbi:MAG: site-specific integrase, partial [Bacteroidales bacterium]|nr:site-specific integrase [Bacteroidales bacterium]
MKKALNHTKVTVKLRKSEYRREWYLYLEAYPVFQAGKKDVMRVREYINRAITTPIWDKSSVAKTTETGRSFKPKRDANGIIQCRSEIDQEACIYADNVCKIRQHEYDNEALYTDKEAEQLEQNGRSQSDFIAYFKKTNLELHKTMSDASVLNWNRVCFLFQSYVGSESFLFSQIDMRTIEGFRRYLLSAPCGGNRKGVISQNTASSYFSVFKAALKQSFMDGYLTMDLSAIVKGIPGKESRREHLTVEELNRLAQTPCDHPVLKRASLFSALTGLRHCDIQKLRWGEIQKDGGSYRLNFTQKKTKGVEYMPISEQAYLLCGEPQAPEKLVFGDLPSPSWLTRPLGRWLKAAGITRHITFPCFRYTYAGREPAPTGSTCQRAVSM